MDGQRERHAGDQAQSHVAAQHLTQVRKTMNEPPGGGGRQCNWYVHQSTCRVPSRGGGAFLLVQVLEHMQLLHSSFVAPGCCPHPPVVLPRGASQCCAGIEAQGHPGQGAGPQAGLNRAGGGVEGWRGAMGVKMSRRGAGDWCQQANTRRINSSNNCRKSLVAALGPGP